jgi:hypothetical protein
MPGRICVARIAMVDVAPISSLVENLSALDGRCHPNPRVVPRPQTPATANNQFYLARMNFGNEREKLQEKATISGLFH